MPSSTMGKGADAFSGTYLLIWLVYLFIYFSFFNFL